MKSAGVFSLVCKFKMMLFPNAKVGGKTSLYIQVNAVCAAKIMSS
jgi:hypothetical protein